MKIKVLYTCLMMICCSLCLVSATGDNEEHLPHYYVEQAKQDFNKNQLDAAKKILDEGLKTYPNDPDMRWLMGRYYYARHDYDKSRYNLIKSIESDYNHVEAKQLLVNVEEETKHYSSAICYVNELLEVNPYWRGLWRRKIELYRKQGNDIEADRLLHRINQIYPNDSIIQRDLNYAMEMNYIKQKKQGNLKEATAALEDLVKKNPKNEQYYLDLTNLYLQQGYTEKALETATMGAEELQGSIELVKKKVGILSDQCRYPEAMAYLRQRMKRNNSPAFAALYNGLMEDAAAAARDNDPYVLYGKIYEKGKSSEALDYLLSTSLSRGYDEDALFYLQEARKRYGNRKDILYKQYSLYKRMGYEREANNLLKRLFAIEPNNYDIANAMCQYELREAERLMANGDWSGALPYAQFVAYHEKQDEETLISAREKIVTCYTQMRRYNEALAALDTLHQKMPAYASYIDKKCYLFDKMGKTQEALDMYYDAFLNSTDGNKVMYASAYEEMAIPYIKKLNEEGAAQKAFDASKRLLSVNPKSDLGLHYAINTADKLGNYDAFEHYTSDGLAYYPNDLFYKIKQSTVYDRKKTFDKSVKLLRPEFEDYPDSPELIGAFSQSSEYYALALLKTNSTDSAMNVVDNALAFDGTNKELKYVKGLIFEKHKLYDSAYVYQKFYEPGAAEAGEYNQHLRGLMNKNYKNEINLAYLQARPAGEDVITSIATAEYTHRSANDEITGTINYKGMDGNHNADDVGTDTINGGTGIQIGGQWMHRFTKTLRGTANFAVANKYFPKVLVNVGLTKELNNDLEVGLKAGFRRLPEKKNLFTLTPNISKTWYPFWTNAKLDLITMSSKLYYNVSAEGRYYLNDDGRTHISAMAGIGSFPELTVVDQYLISNSYSHTNTMVGLGGQVLLTRHLSLGLLGTWYTYYNPYSSVYKNASQYKNLYNVYVQLFINF